MFIEPFWLSTRLQQMPCQVFFMQALHDQNHGTSLFVVEARDQRVAVPTLDPLQLPRDGMYVPVGKKGIATGDLREHFGDEIPCSRFSFPC